MVVICYLKRGSGKALKIHINNYSFFELCALHHPPPQPPLLSAASQGFEIK